MSLQLPEGNRILEKGHSLEPDMVFGQVATVAQIHQSVVDLLIEYISDEKDLVYLGPLIVDTLELHECYANGDNYEFRFDASKRLAQTLISKKRQVMKQDSKRPFQGMRRNDGVQFDSHFESGNLDAVIKVNTNEYDIFMRVDTNTRGHFSWYYFKISNLKIGQKIRLNICNFVKQRCLYERGMKPFVKYHGKDWKQDGDSVTFRQKLFRWVQFHQDFPNLRKFYQLSFELTAKDDFPIEVAYGVPYTFTKLTKYLGDLQNQSLIEVQSFCRSLSGIDVPQVDIGNPEAQLSLVVTGRVHPGESNSSFMIQGFLDFVVRSSELKRLCFVRVIPMLNPDGVILGNYRTGAAGRDLNRQYKQTDRLLYPTVFQLKKLMAETKNLFAYLDFHGHSVKKNVFLYGPEYPIHSQQYLRSRVFAKLLEEKTPMFRFWSGLWRVFRDKKRTARAVFNQKFNITHCFTVEASNGGYYDHNQQKTFDFVAQDWIQMGGLIGEAVLELVKLELGMTKFEADRKVKKLRQGRSQTQLKQVEVKKKPEMVKIMKKIKQEDQQRVPDEEEEIEGRSDSESSEDDCDENQVKTLKEEIMRKEIQGSSLSPEKVSARQMFSHSRLPKRINNISPPRRDDKQDLIVKSTPFRRPILKQNDSDEMFSKRDTSRRGSLNYNHELQELVILKPVARVAKFAELAKILRERESSQRSSQRFHRIPVAALRNNLQTISRERQQIPDNPFSNNQNNSQLLQLLMRREVERRNQFQTDRVVRSHYNSLTVRKR